MTYYINLVEYVGPYSATEVGYAYTFVSEDKEETHTFDDVSYRCVHQDESREAAEEKAKEFAASYIEGNDGYRTVFVYEPDDGNRYYCGKYADVADAFVSDMFDRLGISDVLHGYDSLEEARFFGDPDTDDCFRLTVRQLADWLVEKADATDGDIETLKNKLPKDWKERAKDIIEASSYR